MRLQSEADRAGLGNPHRTGLGCIYFMCMSALPACVCVHGVSAWCHRSQRRALDLELELSLVISCRVGVWDQTWVLSKSHKCSELLRHMSPAYSIEFLSI